jgi:hypothetical protein
MRRLRRFALAGAIVFGGLLGGAPAQALVASPVAHTAVHDGAGSVQLADPASTTTTAAPAAPIDIGPSTEGMPGASLLRKLLAWLMQLALWGSFASILAGAAVYGIAQNSANYNGAYRGKQLAVAGAVGAALAGLAPTAITMLYQAAGGR